MRGIGGLVRLGGVRLYLGPVGRKGGTGDTPGILLVEAGSRREVQVVHEAGKEIDEVPRGSQSCKAGGSKNCWLGS